VLVLSWERIVAEANAEEPVEGGASVSTSTDAEGQYQEEDPDDTAIGWSPTTGIAIWIAANCKRIVNMICCPCGGGGFVCCN
jgi:hypothetical protein